VDREANTIRPIRNGRRPEFFPDPGKKRREMPIEQLIFIGLNHFVVALHRDSGEIVWSNKELHQGYVTLLLDGDRLIASSSGYIYCLNPYTGKILWHNPMKGYGMAVPTAMVSVRGQVNNALIEEQIAQQQAAVVAATAGS
jgi:hypothetical protein